MRSAFTRYTQRCSWVIRRDQTPESTQMAHRFSLGAHASSWASRSSRRRTGRVSLWARSRAASNRAALRGELSATCRARPGPEPPCAAQPGLIRANHGAPTSRFTTSFTLPAVRAQAWLGAPSVRAGVAWAMGPRASGTAKDSCDCMAITVRLEPATEQQIALVMTAWRAGPCRWSR